MPLASPSLPVATSALPAQFGTRELWSRRVLIAFGFVAGLGILAHFAVLLWGQNEFTFPESVVAAQSMMLAHQGTLYYSLRDYPYTVNAYMPLFYLLDAGLIRLNIPALVAGRLISFAALLGIYAVTWRMIMLYTGRLYCAWLGTVLCVSTSLLLTWGTVGQVDTLAICLALTGFYYFSRQRLIRAGVFVILALLTKQTVLAAPTTIFTCLLLSNWKTALRWGAGVAGSLLAVVIGWNAVTHGNFLANTVFANLNPFAIEQIRPHLNLMLIAAGQLILVAAAGARAAWRGRGKALLIYVSFAAATFLATAPKIGSDSNYQIETTILLVLCSAIGLEALGFFDFLFSGHRTWITLLQLPLAIHMVLNFRLTIPLLVSRVVKEQLFRSQVAALRPLVPVSGRVLSTDLNAMARLRGRLDVEPVIYTLLVQAGRIDPTPLQRDLASGAIPTVVLYWDLSKPFESDPKNPSLPQAQLVEIHKRYRMVRHIPGPYLDGVYVYQFADSQSSGERL